MKPGGSRGLVREARGFTGEPIAEPTSDLGVIASERSFVAYPRIAAWFARAFARCDLACVWFAHVFSRVARAFVRSDGVFV